MKYYFIINPAAGHPKNPEIYEKAIAKVMSRFGQSFKIERTQSPGHAKELARQASLRGEIVVAVGGDGTVNEAVHSLINSQTHLGIIPKGSGCGFARELGIPKNPEAACRLLLNAKVLSVDVGEVKSDGSNSARHFINLAGIGLDAQIGEAVNRESRRGLLPYFIHAIKEIKKYKPSGLEIYAGSMTIRAKPLLVAIANAKQYGLGAKIAPKAKINDGLFHVTVVDPMSPKQMIVELPKLFLGKINDCPFVSTFTAKELTVKLERSVACHLDGETFTANNEIAFKVLPAAIRILVPKNYQP